MVEDQLDHSSKIRGDLFAMREKAKNNMLEQHDLVEFLLRKRIFLTTKVKDIGYEKLDADENLLYDYIPMLIELF